MNFAGILPPVITPHRADYSIDEDGFAAMIEHLIAAGVHGVIVGGTTGEYYAQTAEERVALMQLAARTIDGRLPLIIGVGGIRTEDCVALARAARDNGADALLLNAPYYAVPTQRELAEHALAIDRAAGLPVMLYNFPARTGCGMEAEFLERVSRSKNFAAIKESSGDINRLHLLARDYPHLALLCGMDDQALEFFAWGARGWVCAAGNFLAREHLALYRAMALENDVAKGRKIMAALLPLMSVLEQGGKFVQSVKYGCALRGLPAGPARKPLRPLNKAEKRKIERVLETLQTAMTGIELSQGGD